MRDIGPDHRVRDAEDAPEDPADLGAEPCHRASCPVGERHHADAVVRCERHLRAEAGHQPVVPRDEMPAEVVAEERQPDPGQARILLVVRREHAGKSLWLEYLAVLARAAGHQRRHVAGHIPGCRVDRSGADGHQIAVADRARTGRPQRVPGRHPGSDLVGPGEIGVGHAERPEDSVAEISAERLPGEILDDLAERREPVVAIGVPGARLRDQAQPAPVEVGEHRHALAVRHGLAQDRLERARGVDELRKPGRVGQQLPDGGRPVPGLGRNQAVGAQVVARGCVKADQPLLERVAPRRSQ
jgi:hypothetical protein